MGNSEKVREIRLRRMAERQGLQLHKSRRRDPNALGYGCWMITNPWASNVVIGGSVGPTGEPTFSLDEVEAHLTGADRTEGHQ